VLRRVERPVQEGLRFTTEDQWHVTLRFLGAVDDADLDEVVTALAAVRAGAPAEAELRATPRRLGPSAVVLDVDGLDGVAAAVTGALVGLGGDDRRFHGHITLARMRRPARWPAVGVAGLTAPARWPVTSVALVRSDLGGGPARYATLATVPLASP
jgi:2'-5' RNA ligase